MMGKRSRDQTHDVMFFCEITILSLPHDLFETGLILMMCSRGRACLCVACFSMFFYKFRFGRELHLHRPEENLRDKQGNNRSRLKPGRNRMVFQMVGRRQIQRVDLSIG